MRLLPSWLLRACPVGMVVAFAATRYALVAPDCRAARYTTAFARYLRRGYAPVCAFVRSLLPVVVPVACGWIALRAVPRTLLPCARLTRIHRLQRLFAALRVL